MSNNWIVIIFLLFAVLMMSLYLGSQSYNAFAFRKSTLSEYPYEGFATYQESFESRDGFDPSGNIDTVNEPPSLSTESPFPGTTTNVPVPAVPSISIGKPKTFSSILSGNTTNSNPTQNVITQPKSLFPKPKFSVFSKEGFETMPEQQVSTLAGSTYGDEKPVAFLYNNDANITCKNYGYTNSKGFICMSASDIQLLTTRGGNAAGVSDQIGK